MSQNENLFDEESSEVKIEFRERGYYVLNVENITENEIKSIFKSSWTIKEECDVFLNTSIIKTVI